MTELAQGIEPSTTSPNSPLVNTDQERKANAVSTLVESLKQKFRDLFERGLITEEISDLYCRKLQNFIPGGEKIISGYDDLDQPISPSEAKQVLEVISKFETDGYSPEQIRAMVAVSTGKGGAKGVADFAALVAGKNPDDVIAALQADQSWRRSIAYLHRLQDRDGGYLFRKALEELFGAAIHRWEEEEERENQLAYQDFNETPPNLSGNQISVADYLAAPFLAGEKGQRSAEYISTMWLKPGGYCLFNVQTALNKVGFDMGNLGPYAYRSVPRFQNDERFVEVVGEKSELEAMISKRQLPPGTVVYSSRKGDTRGTGNEPYGDVGIISPNGLIKGYDAGKFDSKGNPSLVYGSANTEVLKVFIPVV